MERPVQYLKRILRIAIGAALLGIGVFLAIPGVPGPGLLVIFIGLSILALDFVWAHRLKKKIERAAQEAVHKVYAKKAPCFRATSSSVEKPTG